MSQETRPECANPAIHKVTFHVFWLARFRHAKVTFHPAVSGRVPCGGMSCRPLLLLLKSKPSLIWFAFEQQEQRSTTHSPAGHTSGHSGMKSDFCMSGTREPEHMKSHFVNCRICTFWACLLRHESGAKRVGKARGAYHFSGDGS